MKRFSMVVVSFIGIVGLCFVTCAAAQGSCTADIYDPSVPGSVLVFPKGVSGTTFTGDPLTEFQVSVDCPAGCVCPPDDKVRLKATWVCPGKGMFNVCAKTDFYLYTCDNSPLHSVGSTTNYVVRPATKPGSVTIFQPPCNKAFLVVWATDDYGKPIAFDGLTGTGLVRVSSGAGGTYDAVPFQAETGSCGNTAFDGSSLIFDGVTEFAAGTASVQGTIVIDTATKKNSLIFLTLDDNLGRPNTPTYVDLVVRDQNGCVVLSKSLDFTCWREVPLKNIFGSNPQPTGGSITITASKMILVFEETDSGSPVTIVKFRRLPNTGCAAPTELILH